MAALVPYPGFDGIPKVLNLIPLKNPKVHFGVIASFLSKQSGLKILLVRSSQCGNGVGIPE